MDLREQILVDIRRVEQELAGEPVSRRKYLERGHFSRFTIDRVFGSFTAAIDAAQVQGSKFNVNTASGYDAVRDPAAFVKLTAPAEAERIESRQSIADKIAETMRECAEASGRLPQQLTWYDFREYCKIAYGQNAAGLTPRDITRAGGFNTIRDAYFPPDANEQALERERLKSHAAVNRKLGQHQVRLEDFLERVEEYAERIFFGRVQGDGFTRSEAPARRILTAVISDIHLGSDIKKFETGVLNYGSVEEARRMAWLFQRICSYKLQYRDETELELLFLGDIIENLLHDPRDAAELAEQVCRAIHVLVQGVALVAAWFPAVRVRCVPGNHGRFTSRHPGRATSGKWDAQETVIYQAIRMACHHLKNVTFDIPRTPYLIYEVFGRKVFCTHGDTVFNAGSPSKKIATEPLETRVNRINAALKDIEGLAIVIVGHLHVAAMTELQNRAVLITNGAAVPPNPYAVSLGILDCACSQWLFESVEGQPLGDARLLRIPASVDSDSSLDGFIQPWSWSDSR